MPRTPRSSAAPYAVALVGAGEFGATFAAQVRRLEALRLSLVCDRDLERARDALGRAGYAAEEIVICDARPSIVAAIERGSVAVIGDLSLIADLPLAIVVEATGDPEGAALVAEQALGSGYDLALVTKETEVVIGPMLARRAASAGLVHTPVDGDQPSLLIALVARARALGFPVVAAGKSTESDYVFDPAADTITCWGRTVPASGYRALFEGAGDLRDLLPRRALSALETGTVPDLCEMTIVANHTGLAPDTPGFHAPVARTGELARVFRPAGEGGILGQSGIVDVFACLRRPDELSFAGGVFVVVEAPDATTGRLLAGKGIPGSGDGRYLMLHNPVHLLGAEAPLSVLAAARDRRSSGGSDIRPRFDLVARARRDLEPGEVLKLEDRHTIASLEPLVLTAAQVGPDAPVPYYLAAQRRILRRVPKGSILVGADVALDTESALYRLRREQDRIFAYD